MPYSVAYVAYVRACQFASLQGAEIYENYRGIIGQSCIAAARYQVHLQFRWRFMWDLGYNNHHHDIPQTEYLEEKYRYLSSFYVMYFDIAIEFRLDILSTAISDRKTCRFTVIFT